MPKKTLSNRLVEQLREAAKNDSYENPFFVVVILDALVDYNHYTVEDLDDLYDWAQGLYSQ